MEETINYIINRIYFQKEIEPLCKKFIFKKLLLKLTKGCVFPANRKLLKQVDRCAMGGPISVVFSDIYMCKMEFDEFVPAKPLFYKRYVDDTYVLRRKSIRRMLFKDLNSYHQNIKLTVEVNPSNFLDTELMREKRSILTQVFNKPHKFPDTGVPRFLLDISAMLLLDIFIQQNELRPILIKKYLELEKNIEMLVFHQILLMKLSLILKKK